MEMKAGHSEASRDSESIGGLKPSGKAIDPGEDGNNFKGVQISLLRMSRTTFLLNLENADSTLRPSPDIPTDLSLIGPAFTHVSELRAFKAQSN